MMATFATKCPVALATMFFCVVIATCKLVTSANVSTNGEYVLDEQTRSTLAYKLAPFLVSYSRAAATRTPAPYVKMMNDIIRDPRLGIGADIECDACKELMKAVDDLIQTDESRDLIVEIAAEVCKTLQIEDDRVCDLVVREFKDEVIDVATLHYLSPDQVCGTLLGPSCAIPYDYNSDWNVTFPSIPKPHMTPVQPPQPDSPTLRVLHISDLHIDLMYEPGSNAECGEPLCCRSNDGPPAPGTKGAGKWGDFRTCDVSLDLMKNTLENIAKTQKVDFIYMTGDLPAHNVWNQTRSDQLKILDMVTDLLIKYFPGVKVYPTLGNHESAPVNSFPPEFITGDQSEKWLYEACVSSWIEKSGWLPESAKETMLRGGYYDVQVYPGFRVVSLNANAGNTQNWWLRINATDPDAQLQWLVSVLQAAETAKEKVHILGHIPPSQNLAVWSKNYDLIVKRYASTITGQFFGHTHKDQFKIYYDNVTNRQPINVVYVAGAITPDTQNPGYRVYTIEGNYTKSSWAVLDHDNYYLNLTEANLTDKPTWRLEYTAKKAFNMTSLQPSEWGRVVEEMKKNETVFDQYYAYFHRLWEGRAPCDASCRQNMICDIETARSGDSSYC